MLPESFGGRIIYLLQQYGPSFAKGAGVSMWLALVGTLFGCIIGFLVGIVQTIPVDKNDSTAKKVLIKIVKFILACYVEFFRGTPMMAQAMFIYFGSAYLFNINMSMWFAAIFIVSINTGAYMAETVRGFCVGKKNWQMIDTINGAKSSAIIYSIAETAKANNLKPYEYFEHLLTEIPKHINLKTW